jgi:hypothetical protein
LSRSTPQNPVNKMVTLRPSVPSLAESHPASSPSLVHLDVGPDWHVAVGDAGVVTCEPVLVGETLGG